MDHVRDLREVQKDREVTNAEIEAEYRTGLVDRLKSQLEDGMEAARAAGVEGEQVPLIGALLIVAAEIDMIRCEVHHLGLVAE